MAEQNYTIPVNEIFEKTGGCPLCRLQAALEERCIEYVTGPAMMEPDVRIKTNEQGFCRGHYAAMQSRVKALPVALVMESHLKHIQKNLVGEKPGAYKASKRPGRKSPLGEMLNDCYVCGKLRRQFSQTLDTVYLLWRQNRGFRALYAGQEHLCLRHYDDVMAGAETALKKQDLAAFREESHRLAAGYLNALLEDVSHFCRMFDYRGAQAGAGWGSSKDAVRRAAEFLKEK